MKGYYRHILLLAAAVMAADGCTKTHVEETPSEPMPISISAVDGAATKALLNNGTFNTTPGASAPATKAMLDGDAFKKEGNRIQVYDYVDGEFYFSDQIGPEVTGNNYGFEGVWPFVNGPHQWTPGTHKFFGWLVNDVNGTTDKADDLSPVSIFGDNFACKTETVDNVTNVNVAAFNKTTQTLTIPATTMSPTTPQFDFMYSDIFTTEPINEPVELEFSHLFCAVSFGIVNDASSSVSVQNFSVTLYDTKSANIDYSATGIPVYTATNTKPSTFRTITSPGTLSGMNNGVSDSWPNVFAPSSNDKEYILMWPQTEEELANCKINITYTLNSQLYEQVLSFPAMALDAGERYHFDIFIADKAGIKINYMVVDWASIENNYTFE